MCHIVVHVEIFATHSPPTSGLLYRQCNLVYPLQLLLFFVFFFALRKLCEQ